MNLYKINQLAIEFRLDIGLEHDTPLDFFPVITNKLRNLTIVFLEMDEKISGACFKVDSQQIILNIQKEGRCSLQLMKYIIYFTKMLLSQFAI